MSTLFFRRPPRFVVRREFQPFARRLYSGVRNPARWANRRSLLSVKGRRTTSLTFARVITRRGGGVFHSARPLSNPASATMGHGGLKPMRKLIFTGILLGLALGFQGCGGGTTAAARPAPSARGNWVGTITGNPRRTSQPQRHLPARDEFQRQPRRRLQRPVVRSTVPGGATAAGQVRQRYGTNNLHGHVVDHAPAPLRAAPGPAVSTWTVGQN